MNVFVRECGRRAVLVARGIVVGKWRKAAVVGAAVLSIGLFWGVEVQAGWLVAWGHDGSGFPGRAREDGLRWPTVPPKVPPGDDFVSVAAGAYGVALREDGSLLTWNYRTGESWVPVEGNDFVAIAAGLGHGLALRADGSLAGWGGNIYGQADVPPGNEFVAIGAGDFHSLAVTADGTLLAWGNNQHGECDVPAIHDFVAADGGWYHTLALRRDGSLASWGRNQGDLAVPPGDDYSLIASNGCNAAIREDGSLAWWSDVFSGLWQVPPGNDFIAVSSGQLHSLALTVSGSAVAWGSNTLGECDVPSGYRFSAIAATDGASFAIAVPEPSTLPACGSLATIVFAWVFRGLLRRARPSAPR